MKITNNFRKHITNISLVILIQILTLTLLSSCGPSAEEQRQQEIEDSIQLEKDRRDLLERANRMFDAPADTLEPIADNDSL